MAVKTQVVEELLDSVTKHSIELQRVANKMQGAVAREFKKLARDLDGIVARHNFSVPMSGAKRKIMLANAIKEGKAAIKKANLSMARVVKDKLIDVGNLETKFSVGSINKAVTGKGTIKFATETVPAKKISTMADNLIIRGVSQKELYSRQAAALGNKFKDVIRNGYLNNQSIGTISQNIRGTAAAGFKDGIMNVSRNHANTLARTSISSIANQVREETYIANSDVVEGVQFLAVLDSDTTRVCRAHSGDKWKYTSAGWINIQGGHDYVQPPLHFNCRSTTIPLVFPAEVLAKTVPAKLALVPKDRARSMGMPLPPGLKKSVDADAWLHAQPVEYQQEVLGKAFPMWAEGKVSFKRFVTQKGRVRSVDEIEKMYAADGIIPKEVVAPKIEGKFKVNTGVSKEFKDALNETSKAEFLALEERLMIGKSITRAESDKLGIVFKNADSSDLELAKGFHPTDFKDFLGSKSKRLAFYNHTAKRFEKQSNLHKGDLSNRITKPLSEVDNQVLKEVQDRIIKSTSGTNRTILLEMFDEASQIVGTQRSLPMIESLLSLAKKGDFSDIDSFLGYLNNSLGNAVNSYFSRAARLEVRFTSSIGKQQRYARLTENAEKTYAAEINRNGTSLAEASAVKKMLEKIGKRKLRNFDGDELNYLSVNMEVSMRDNISLYLKYLADDVRMSDDQIVSFMKRVSGQGGVTKSERLHQARVQYILNLDQQGKAHLSDSLLKSKLFKGWTDDIWSNRGLSDKIREELGQVLSDVNLYKGMRSYLSTRNGNEVLGSVLKSARKVSTVTIERELKNLVALDAKARKKVILKREKVFENKINQEGRFAKIERSKAKLSREEQVRIQREESAQSWREASDGKYVLDISLELEKLTKKVFQKAKHVLQEQAAAVAGEDVVAIAQLVNRHLFSAVEKGQPYVAAAKSLGKKYFKQFKGLTNIEEDQLVRMGHFLIESAVNAKIVKRTKVLMLAKGEYGKKIRLRTWRLQETNDAWKQAFLSNKKNYDVDGLPSVGKAPKFDSDGLYANGSPVIRGVDEKWLSEQVKKPSAKRWLDNLKDEAETGIKVNGYIFDVMEELENLGKSIIPRRGFNKDKVALSKYDSYIRAKEMARGLRDQKFYNRMSNDKFSRTYADTVALQWQGDDVNRGLMMFHRGAKMGTTGELDFARNFMNLAGFDKLPMQLRHRLFKKIDEDLITKTVKDPVKNDWWYTDRNWIESGIIKNLDGFSKAERDLIEIIAKKANPEGEGAFQFLAMLKERSEMIKWVKSGNKIDDFVSHLPSQRDGTTNVLQHFAAISREAKMAQDVNMAIVKGRDVVEDAYMKLRNAIDDIVDSLDDDIIQYILPDVEGGLTYAQRRKSVKTALMTTQYNAGAETLGKSYFDGLKKVQVLVDGKKVKVFQDMLDMSDSKEAIAIFKKIGNLVIEQSEKIYPQATTVRKTLNLMAEAHEIAGQGAIQVKTPNMGFPFRQSYKKKATRQIELVDTSGKTMKLDIRFELDEINYAKQKIAFAPNIIHSMDATHKSLVVEALKKAGIKDFSMIHDSFGTNFGNMDLLSKVTKETFLELYKGKNFLRFLADEFEAGGVPMKRYARNKETGVRMKKKDSEEWIIEDIPKDVFDIKGTYDFEDFMELEYFFH